MQRLGKNRLLQVPGILILVNALLQAVVEDKALYFMLRCGKTPVLVGITRKADRRKEQQFLHLLE